MRAGRPTLRVVLETLIANREDVSSGHVRVLVVVCVLREHSFVAWLVTILDEVTLDEGQLLIQEVGDPNIRQRVH